MKLRLLDVNHFIEKKGLKQVKNTKIYTGGSRQTLDPNGLFSEEIFGRMGSRQRRSTFGFIDLSTKVIHPEAYPVLLSINTDLAKLIMDKTTYIIEEGNLIKNDKGDSGVLFFIKNFDKIDFTKLAKENKKEEATFITKFKNRILIDKFLVLPAGIRDINVSKKTGQTTYQFSEVTTLYERLIKLSSSIISDIDTLPEDITKSIIKDIQSALLNLTTWVKNRMKGKHGLIRGGLLRKVTDYSGRMVISPDPKLKLGYIGLPWQTILKFFEPFAINYILYKDRTSLTIIQDYLSTEENLDIRDIKRLIAKVNSEPETVMGQLKNYLKQVAEEITREKVIVYKRDPAENRDSWISSYIRVDDIGYTAKINPFDLCKNGLQQAA